MRLPFNIIKSSTLESLKTKANESRPDRGLYTSVGSADTGLVPLVPITYFDCQNIVKSSDTLTTILNSLKQEIFRNGGDFKERFVNKCSSCGKEYDKEVMACDACGGITVEADAKQLVTIKPFFTREAVNYNGQLMEEVMQQLEDDFNTVDIAFLLVNKEYSFINGELLRALPKELLRIDPSMTRLIADKKGNLGVDENGKEVYTCLLHRDTIVHEAGHCSICGNRLFKASYVCVNQQNKNSYYTHEEMFHTTKYTKSLTYGWPPVILVWRKVSTLIYQDDLILDWYKGKKPPRGILLVATRAWSQLTKAWDWLLAKTATDKHGIYPLGIEVPSGKSGKLAEFISFMNNLEEMQYTETREEMRRTIGALYGVMPIFQGDNSTSGGLNNEGLQVTVTVRAALSGQNVYNKKLFPWLLKQFGVTDWDYILNSPEEKDEMAELQREQLMIQNAQAMHAMGFNVTYNESGEFDYSGEASDPMAMMGGAPMGGMPPMGDELPVEEPSPDGQPEPFNKSIDRSIKEIASDELTGIEKEVNKNIIMKADDLDEFIKKAIYDLAFSGVSKKKSDLIKDYLISKAGERVGFDTIVKEIIKIADLTKEEGERIARTEFLSVIQNKAREYGYEHSDPEGVNKYVWQGPDDKRVTKYCNNIKKKVGRGVSLKKLKEIIKEESDPNVYDDSRPWSPHINCRHRLIRKV